MTIRFLLGAVISLQAFCVANAGLMLPTDFEDTPTISSREAPVHSERDEQEEDDQKQIGSIGTSAPFAPQSNTQTNTSVDSGNTACIAWTRDDVADKTWTQLLCVDSIRITDPPQSRLFRPPRNAS